MKNIAAKFAMVFGLFAFAFSAFAVTGGAAFALAGLGYAGGRFFADRKAAVG